MPNTHTHTPLRTGFLRSFIRWLVIGVVLLWSLAAVTLVAARWIDPPTTAVHIQRCNVVEWGPGIYGAESACRYYDGTAARSIGLLQACCDSAGSPEATTRAHE